MTKRTIRLRISRWITIEGKLEHGSVISVEVETLSKCHLKLIIVAIVTQVRPKKRTISH